MNAGFSENLKSMERKYNDRRGDEAAIVGDLVNEICTFESLWLKQDTLLLLNKEPNDERSDSSTGRIEGNRR